MASPYSATWRHDVVADLDGKQPLDADLTQLADSGTVNLFGGQIAFPATQVPSADPNTLDDYEEGTFTSIVSGTTAAGAGTYTDQNGQYIKIGRLVAFRFRAAWSAHTGTGNIIFNIPFAAANDTYSWPLSVLSNTLTFTGQLTAATLSNTSTGGLFTISSGGGITALPMDTTALVNISGVYTAAG